MLSADGLTCWVFSWVLRCGCLFRFGFYLLLDGCEFVGCFILTLGTDPAGRFCVENVVNFALFGCG